MRCLLCFTLTLAMIASLSCDGSSAGGNFSDSCPAFTACGGDAVGTWTVVAVCTSVPSTGTALCVARPTAAQDYRYDGTLSFSSDGSYSLSFTTRGDMRITYSADCLASRSTTCADLDATLRSGNAPEGISGSCTSSSTNDCICAETFDTTFDETGAYVASGGALTLTNSSSEVQQFEYCAQSSQLALRQTDATGTMFGLAFSK
jgi:hypothetical protein